MSEEIKPLQDVSATEDPSQKRKVKKTKRHMNAFQLMLMVYFLSSGGPYGIEPAVQAGGPLLTIISIVVVCLVWSFPQALLSAELGMMMDVNGGNIIWVLRPFGRFLGFLNAQGALISFLANQAIYLAVYLEYFNTTKPPFNEVWVQWMLCLALVLLIALLNMGGVRWISRLSGVITVFIWSPFFIEIVYLIFFRDQIHTTVTTVDLPSTKPDASTAPHSEHPFSLANLLQIAHPIQWNLLIPTAVWAMDGFDQIGSLAGEVKGGKKTFILGILGSFPLIFLNYLLPVAVGYMILPHWTVWGVGHFSNIAHHVAPWLGYYTLAASIVNNASQYNASLAGIARMVWAMAEGADMPKVLPKFLGWSFVRKTGTIRPIAAIIFASIVPFVVRPLGYNFLVQLYFGLRILMLGMEYAALIALRIREPEAERPFSIPGGIVAVCLLPIPSLILGGVSVYYQITSPGGLDVIYTTIGSVAVIMLGYLWKWLWTNYWCASGYKSIQ